MDQLNLYFLRHAIAVPRGRLEFPEEERPLTEEGREKMLRGARGIKKLGLGFESILSSPYTRAYETAEITRTVLDHLPEIEICKDLVPGGSLENFLQSLANRPERNILLVGHEPAMSSWIQDLLGCGMEGTILMKKGALAYLRLDLQMDPPEIEFVFLLQPKVLRRLG